MKTKRIERHLFTMPTTMTSDRELEYEPIRGHQIPALIRFWRWHLLHGSITAEEHRAISCIMLCIYERQSGESIE